MSKSFLAVLTAAIMITAGAASANAQMAPHSTQHLYSAAACNPFAGTVYDNVYPFGSTPRSCDPVAGTKWEGWGPL
jgi:hypothetical protein